VTTRSSPLVASPSTACADGTVEETFTGGLVGCAGRVAWADRRILCGWSYRPATAAEWVANGGVAPQHDYWTNDDLHFDGVGSSCTVSLTAPYACTGMPMRVCTAAASPGTDPEGNRCNWTNCGLNDYNPRFFGGCSGNSTAGTLCIRSACADGSIEQTFSNGMVGCAGKVTWANRRNLCGAGYRPATAIEWVANGGVAPQHDYWTDDDLRFGGGPSSCTVSATTGAVCTATPMRVCTATAAPGSDPEGNQCNWTNCGLNDTTPRFFGGCAGNTTAGTLCVPDGCADATVEQTFANGMVGCGGTASSSAAAGALCAPGFRLATLAEFNSLDNPHRGTLVQITPSQNFWTQTTRVCPWNGCGTGSTGGAVCVPQRGCADGTAEQVMPNGLVGCGGAVAWADRDSLCARGYRSATAAQWSALNQSTPAITPMHHYWTADSLNLNVLSGGCSASTSSGSACNPGQPMRLCTATGSDPEGNTCQWTNCGLDALLPNLNFGGCNTPTAGTLCVATDLSPGDIIHGDSRLMNVLYGAQSSFREAPALAAAVVVDGKIYVGAVGKRRSTDATATLLESDKFQLDSVSKIFAGAVLTRAVDQTALSWDTRVGSLLPSIFQQGGPPFPWPTYQDVTVAELAAHASGFEVNTRASSYHLTPDATNNYINYPNIMDRRVYYARDAVQDAPLFLHGTGELYGTGQVSAIAMLEQTVLAPYEQLLQDFLYRPLGMTHTGTIADVWGHTYDISTGILGPPLAPEDFSSALGLPSAGVAASIEDVARLLHAVLYSPQAPCHAWSYGTQQSLINGVGQSGWSAAGWTVEVRNDAGGLQLWKDGSKGRDNSWVELWPMRRAAFAVLTNYGQVGDLARVVYYLSDQVRALLPQLGGPPAAFPYPDAPTLHATNVSATSEFSADYGAAKAFDGDYNTRWNAACPSAGDTTATLQVTLPAQTAIGHVVINEAGPFPSTPLYSSFEIPAWNVTQTRVKSWQLYLANGSTSWLAAQGTTLGINKVIPVNGYGGVTAAGLTMTGTNCPSITEMHLLPW